MRIDSKVLVALLMMLCVLAGCDWSSTDTSSTAKKDEVVMVDGGDKEMNAAMEKARNSLNEFRDRFKNPQPTDSMFSVKVRIKDENRTEHFWAKVIRIEGDGFVGTIDNHPRIVKNINMGDEVKITKDNLSDWSYHNNGKMIGGFTVRVLLKRIPEDQAEALKKQIGWD
jgi:uncharacterized protein YegJ (DUF2314 family)